MKKLLQHPIFWLGLLIRISFMALILPKAAEIWYAPFLESSIAHASLDPWGVWRAGGHALEAFPYGYVMWLVFLPLACLFHLLNLPLIVSYQVTLLLVDFALLLVLRQMLHQILPKRDNLLLGAYWLSPILLLATYGFGLNDVIPVTLLLLSLLSMRQMHSWRAGAFCVAAISAKLSMVLALPFFLVYLSRNRALRQLLPQFLQGVSVTGVVLGLPFLLSPAAMEMLFGNPEMSKVLQLSLHLGAQAEIYLVPMAYLLMLYAAWRVRRLNFELFHAMLGLAFLLVAMLTPGSLGWFIWALPALVLYQASSDKIAVGLIATLSLLSLMTSLLQPPRMNLVLGDTAFAIPPLLEYINPHISSLLHTAMIAIGVVLALRIWRQAITSNDFFRLSRKPFVIGIAGDSGAGKDTLAEALRLLFGDHSVAHLSGDDYHLWDRHKPMWQVMTHLNPMANDIDGFTADLLALSDGKAVRVRHYDHTTGKMSHPALIQSNDFILASSLHALYSPLLRDCYNLAIYLDIDEDLRRFYKMQRDTRVRGHSREQVTSNLAKREPDSARYIRPQAEHADLVLSLQAIHPRLLEESAESASTPPRLKLSVRSKNGQNEMALMRVLVGICGLHVDRILHTDTNQVELVIEGETEAKDVAMAAQILFPRILSFLDIAPDWKDGMLGLMQLITLAHIHQALQRRLLSQPTSIP